MEIIWENLKVEEFFKICRLCLANKELERLAEEEKSTLIKLTPWITELETSAFFPNNICSDCAKQLQQANEFFNRCNTLANSLHKCIEEYKECIKEDNELPSLEVLLFPTKVKIKQEVEPDHEKEEATTVMPFTEVFMPENIKMEFECTESVPEQTTSNLNNTEYIESTPDIPAAQWRQCPTVTDQKSVNPTKECSEIIKFLKRSVRGKLVIAYFEKNKKLNCYMRETLADSLIENLMDNFNVRIHIADLSKLAESIAEIFPTENKETYLNNNKRGKLYSKYRNLKRQCQNAGLVPKTLIASEEDTETDIEQTEIESEEDGYTIKPFMEFQPKEIKQEEIELEETKFIPQQISNYIESTPEFPVKKPRLTSAEKMRAFRQRQREKRMQQNSNDSLSIISEKRRQTSAERMQGFRQGQHEKQMLDNAVVAPPQNGYKHVDSGQSNKIPITRRRLTSAEKMRAYRQRQREKQLRETSAV